MFMKIVAAAFASSIAIACSGCYTPTQNEPAASPAATALAAKPTPADNWQISTEANELDHSKKVALNNRELYVRCSPKLEAYVTPSLPQLGGMLDTESGHSQVVRYRLDEGPIHSESWAISDDFTALFLPTSTIRKLPTSKKLTLEYKPEYVTAMTTTVDLAGLPDALKKAGCKL
jgi:hypothetical protein